MPSRYEWLVRRAQSPDDLVAKLFDGAPCRLNVAGGEEGDLAVRTHRLSGVQIVLVEDGYFDDVVWTQQERRAVRRHVQLRGDCHITWLTHGKYWGRRGILSFHPSLQGPLVDGVPPWIATCENEDKREKTPQRRQARNFAHVRDRERPGDGVQAEEIPNPPPRRGRNRLERHRSRHSVRRGSPSIIMVNKGYVVPSGAAVGAIPR